MGKISKYANLYNKEGDLIRQVNEDGILTDYTLEELEELVDKLGNDKDDNGKIRDVQAFNNASSMLFQYYQKYGNPHEAELIESLKKVNQRSTEEQVTDALNEVANDIEAPKETVMDEYVSYEEVTE